MKKTILLFVYFLPLFSFAQTTLEFNSDIGLFNSAWDAQTLLNSLQYIDDQQKQALLNQLNSENGFVVDINNEIKFTSNRFSIAFGNHIFSYGLFDKNLVQLGLYGNTTSLGQSFDLLPLESKLIHYSDVEVGYQFDDKFWAGLSFIAGHQMLSAEFLRLDYSSGQNGEFLSYDLLFEGVESGRWQYYLDSISEFEDINNLYNTLGRGIALNFEFVEYISDGTLVIKVQDLGFVRWNENTSHYNISTSDLLQPLEVNDFNNIDTDFLVDKLDTLENLIDPYAEAYYMSLPTRFMSSFTKSINNKYADLATISAYHVLNVYTTPRLSIDFHKLYKKSELILGYHLGGLEKNGLQIQYLYKTKKVHYNLFTRELGLYDMSQTQALHIGMGLKFIF